MSFHTALAGVTLIFGVAPLTTAAAASAAPTLRDVYYVTKWRALRWAANRAFALARALNRAKNQTHWDHVN